MVFVFLHLIYFIVWCPQFHPCCQEMARFYLLFSHSTSGYSSEEYKNTNLENTCIPMFTAALLTIAKIETTDVCQPMDKRIKNMWCINMYICIYTHSAIRKDNKDKNLLLEKIKYSGLFLDHSVLLCFYFLPYFFFFLPYF